MISVLWLQSNVSYQPLPYNDRLSTVTKLLGPNFNENEVIENLAMNDSYI